MRYALITGGSGGIGFELAKCFAGDGFGLVLASSHAGRLGAAQETLRTEFGVPVEVVQADLSRAGAAETLYQQVKDSGIALAALVNNAGFGLVGPSEKIDLVREQSLLTLNIEALVTLSKLVLRDFYTQGSGKLLNVASTGAFQPGPYTASYFASKAFVLSYTRAVHYEAKKRGVQVCALCPGTTRTDFFIREGVGTPAWAMAPERVARYAYRRLKQGRAIAVPGFMNQMLRMVPSGIKMSVISKMKQVQKPDA